MHFSLPLFFAYVGNVMALPTEERKALSRQECPVVRCNVIAHAERCTIACMNCHARYGEVG